MINIPVSFAEKARQPKGNQGYPVQLSAEDLDKNFTYAALDVPDDWVEESTGPGGHSGSILRLPPFPGGSVLHVLGVQNGALVWVETEDC